VDIDEMMDSLAAIKKMVRRTAVKGQLGGIGSFGGLFKSPGRDMVLVASTDGVGTKLKVAVMAKRHDTVGRDLVNHCVNDILAQGASPLFFMDYLGTARLKGKVFKEIVSGLCRACRENGCSLLGGETAEMPGLYPAGEYDLVGTIVGAVPRKKIITGERIRSGDVIIALKSSGLHTNGYSLARKVIFQKAGLKPHSKFPGTVKSVADVLLTVHKSYLKPVTAVMKQVQISGMAHITGGGLPDNVARVMPDGLSAQFDLSGHRVPHVFRFIQETGRVDIEEMYRVFNMGIGFVLFVRQSAAGTIMRILKKAKAGPAIIGSVRKKG